MPNIRRINKELKEFENITNDLPENINAWPINNDLLNWEATIIGPSNTPYVDGIFFLKITLPNDYPFGPPQVNFLSRIILKFLLKIKTVTLVNIVTETNSVPEFLGAKCQPVAIADALMELLNSQELRSKQIEVHKVCMARLMLEGDLNQGDFAAVKVIEQLNYNV